MGLRELKKEQTRTLIADIAWRLFVDRGFDAVRVAEIAREARVSEATVFNYFPRKEDLLYSRLDDFGERLIAAVDSRPPGASVLDAVRTFLTGATGLLAQVAAGDDEALVRLRTVHRMIADSPTLRAREQQAITDATTALAALLAADQGDTAETDEVTAYVAANALMGVHRALIDLVRRRVLADEAPDQLADDVRARGTRAFSLLAQGLADHGVRPRAGNGR
ncbi:MULTISPECIES: TetR/AcrR family transcriptional regulator [unclassified Streptomyces]|uniref:TetR/AcrR family transcriptional regulator n=1 Tax=unclassified Streptomyces TaxID=2593676 RepID=UPI00190CA42D|nr:MULTISPECIES: TetR family transcriptional regulator [unclassified Streptomyces]MBK3566272.1 TetR family transcriptional regulator [Streptomyces sp. MBT62]MBK6011022.1 TetR family transcriptional regulator [Streptomyces sp. MBT53]